MDIGFREILLIIVIIMVLFGARRIPDMVKSMGQGVKEFKKAAKEEDDEHKPSDDKKEVVKTHSSN